MCVEISSLRFLEVYNAYQNRYMLLFSIHISMIGSYCCVEYTELKKKKDDYIFFGKIDENGFVTMIETKTGTKYVIAGDFTSSIKDYIHCEI